MNSFNNPNMTSAAPGMIPFASNMTSGVFSGMEHNMAQFQIERLVAVVQPPIPNQVIRPLTSNLDSSTISGLQTLIERQNVTKFTPNLLNGFAGRILVPSTQASGDVSIANGWGTQRYAFTLVIRARMNTGANSRYYVNGYSESPDLVSYGGAKNPNMVFYIDSVTKANLLEIQHLGGTVVTEVPAESNHLLTSTNYAVPLNQTANLYSMLPNEIVATLYVNASLGSNGSPAHYQNHIQDITPEAKLSTFGNCSPTNYITRTLNGFSTALQAEGYMDTFAGILSNSQGEMPESMPTQDPFMAALARAQNTPLATSSFTLAHLSAIDPSFHIADTRYQHHGVVDSYRDPNATASWAGQSREATMASLIASCMPYFLVSSSLSFLNFKATNADYVTGRDFEPFGGSAISPVLNIQRCIEKFREIFKMQLETEITMNGTCSYALSCQATTTGTMVIDLSINGGPVYNFVFPAFASAQMAPIVSNTLQQTNTIVGAFGSMMQSVYDSMMASASNTGVGFGIQQQFLNNGV